MRAMESLRSARAAHQPPPGRNAATQKECTDLPGSGGLPVGLSNSSPRTPKITTSTTEGVYMMGSWFRRAAGGADKFLHSDAGDKNDYDRHLLVWCRGQSHTRFGRLTRWVAAKGACWKEGSCHIDTHTKWLV